MADFVLQLRLLQFTSVNTTLAGLNTELGSLSSGVPMMANPIAYDQPDVAALCH